MFDLAGALIIFLIFAIPILVIRAFSASYDDTADFVQYFLTLSLVVIFVVGGIVYVHNYSQLVKQEVFYNIATQNYQYTIRETENVRLEWAADLESEGLSTENLSYFGIASHYSERLKEFRDRINEYNDFIHMMRKYNKNLLFAWCLPTPSDDLKLIALE
jgi:hypothetical protein